MFSEKKFQKKKSQKMNIIIKQSKLNEYEISKIIAYALIIIIINNNITYKFLYNYKITFFSH